MLVTPPEGGLREPSVVSLNQIRSVDKQRLVKRLGTLKPATIARVYKALRMAAHSSPRAIKLYDRRGDRITLDEIERIVLK